MRILATRLFVTNVELSIIYQVKIHIGTNGEISANFTLNASKGAALEVTLQSLNPEATITSTPLDNHETQEQPQSITYHFQTTFANFKKTLEGLKDSSLISMGFANDICHAVPILMTQSLGKLPKISIAADNIDENYVENLFSPLTTWSAKIDVIEDKRLFWFDPIFKPKARLRILTENEAHSLVKVYTHDFFVIFCRNDTYHLLTRNNSKIEQFDILTRSVKISTRKQLLSQLIGKNEKTLFNLKNAITGELILGEGIQASSLHEFVISPYLKEKYHSQLALDKIKIFNVNRLELLALKHFIINGFTASQLLNLSDDLQDKFLFYFLDMFIANLHQENIQAFRNDILFDSWKPKYRQHYNINKIAENIAFLRTLYVRGNAKIALLLAAIDYSGLSEEKSVNQEVLFHNLNEFHNITQDKQHVPDKIMRDLFLLKFFKATNDEINTKKLLSEINLSQAVFLSDNLCSDSLLFDCIKCDPDKFNQLLIKNKQIFLHILSSRISLAKMIILDIPEEMLKIKDENGCNILHILINYISIHNIVSSFFVMEIFKYVCPNFPEMLAEHNHQGKSVYAKIEELKPHCDVDLYATILSITDQFPIATQSLKCG